MWLPLTPPASAPLRRASQPARHSVSDGGHPLPASLRLRGEGVRSRRAPASSLSNRDGVLSYSGSAGTTRGEIRMCRLYIARPVRKAVRLRAFTPAAGLLANCGMFARSGVAADTFGSENDIEPPYRRWRTENSSASS